MVGRNSGPESGPGLVSEVDGNANGNINSSLCNESPLGSSDADKLDKRSFSYKKGKSWKRGKQVGSSGSSLDQCCGKRKLHTEDNGVFVECKRARSLVKHSGSEVDFNGFSEVAEGWHDKEVVVDGSAIQVTSNLVSVAEEDDVSVGRSSPARRV